jgi:hypothetical protein
MVGLGVRVRDAGRKCFTLDYAFEGRGRRLSFWNNQTLTCE